MNVLKKIRTREERTIKKPTRTQPQIKKKQPTYVHQPHQVLRLMGFEFRGNDIECKFLTLNQKDESPITCIVEDFASHDLWIGNKYRVFGRESLVFDQNQVFLVEKIVPLI